MSQEPEPLRRARSDDGPAISAVLLRSRRAAQIPVGIHSEDEVRAWVEVHLLPTCDVWVALEAGEVVGVMALSDGWIEQLYIAPEHQRRGHGARLLQVAQSEQSSLTLWTFQSNVTARRFYEAHAFVRSGPVSDANEEGAPAIRYTWARAGRADG